MLEHEMKSLESVQGEDIYLNQPLQDRREIAGNVDPSSFGGNEQSKRRRFFARREPEVLA